MNLQHWLMINLSLFDDQSLRLLTFFIVYPDTLFLSFHKLEVGPNPRWLLLAVIQLFINQIHHEWHNIVNIQL